MYHGKGKGKIDFSVEADSIRLAPVSANSVTDTGLPGTLFEHVQHLLLEVDGDYAAFVAHEPGVLRRELIRKADGHYADIVRFRSVEDAQAVIEKEQSSEVCRAFFSLMDMSGDGDDAQMGPFASLAVYG